MFPPPTPPPSPPPVPRPPDPNERLTVKDVAEMIGMSTGFVYKLVHAGRIGCSKFGTGYRFTRADVDAYLQSARRPPEPPPVPASPPAPPSVGPPPPDPGAPPALGVPDVAVLIGRSPGHVRELVARGRIGCTRTPDPRGGEKVTFTPADVAAYLNALGKTAK